MAEPGAIAVITIRYFAAARAAAGVEEEKVELAAPSTVGAVLAAAVRRHGAALERVLQRCSFLLDATAVHDARAVITQDAVVDVLPPFAGG